MKRFYLCIFALILAVVSPSKATAATYTETFTNGVLSTGISIKQNGLDIVISPASPIDGTEAQYNSKYAGSYGLVGYYLNLHQVTTDVTVTFPTNARPTSFSFIASIVNGAQPMSYTYSDGTSVNFNAPDTVNGYPPNFYTTYTVSGDGRPISNFKIIGGVSRDYWALENLTWSAASLSQSTTTLTSTAVGGYRSNISLTANVNTAGKITFYADGKRIPGCVSRPVTSLITCNWKPNIHKAFLLTATLRPTDSNWISSTSSPISVRAIARTNRR